MNRARFVAALIAAVGVTITVTGAGSALWLYRHEPAPRHPHTPLLPAASSAPFPPSALGTRPQTQPQRLLQRLGQTVPGPRRDRGRPGRSGHAGAPGALAPVPGRH